MSEAGSIVRKRASLVLGACVLVALSQTGGVMAADSPRQKISIDDDWRFTKGDPEGMTANLTLLTVGGGGRGGRGGGAAPAGIGGAGANQTLWPYIMASSNDFIADPSKRVARPADGPYPLWPSRIARATASISGAGVWNPNATGSPMLR